MFEIGQAVRFEGLPCEGEFGLEVDAGEACDQDAEILHVDGPLNSWSVRLRTARRPRVAFHVIDEESLEPVVGARLRIASRLDPLITDEGGWTEAATVIDRYLPEVDAEGYASQAVSLGTIDRDAETVELSMRPLGETTVRCVDAGAPCPDGTHLEIIGGEVGDSTWLCTQRDEWSWSCPASFEDDVMANQGTRHSDRIPVSLAGTTVTLKQNEGELCLSAKMDGTCRLSYAPHGETRGQGRGGGGSAPNGARLGVELPPGEIVDALYWCQDGAWQGQAEVQNPGSLCRDVSLELLGSLCVDDLGMCSGRLRPSLTVKVQFSGCTDVPAGDWSLVCGGRNFDVNVPPGGTVYPSKM